MSEEIKPVIEGVSSEDACLKPVPESTAQPEAVDNKRYGMPHEQAQQFFNLCLLGLERMSQRQRTMFRRAAKAACRDLNHRWPNGRPMADIEREIAERQVKPQIIIPSGVNADALKERP